MNTSKARHLRVVCSVGGRSYRLADCSPTCVRLEDLLDGHCLSFTQAEALQMIVQQDMIIVRSAAITPRVQPDRRDRPHRPDEPPEDAAERLAEATESARRPAVGRRDATEGDNHQRTGAEERPCHCTQRQPWVARLGHRPTGQVRTIILDEFRRYLIPETASEVQFLALMNSYAQALKLCPDIGGIAGCQQGEERWLSAHHRTIAATTLGGHRLKQPTSTFITTLGVAPHSRLVGRPHPHWFQADPSTHSLARHPLGGARERAEWRRATAGHGLKSALDAEVGDVE